METVASAAFAGPAPKSGLPDKGQRAAVKRQGSVKISAFFHNVFLLDIDISSLSYLLKTVNRR